MKIYLAFLTSLLLATTSVAQTNTSTNTVYGYNSGQAINTTSAIRNVYLGANAGQFSSSTDNTFVGHLAGSASSNSGYSNTFIGSRAGLNNTSGYINVFVGGLAGMSNTTGFANVYVGPTAGANNSTGNYNMFLGNSTGANVVSGDGNVFIGDGAGYGSTTGGNNTYIGRWAGFSGNAGGSYNTFIGVGSGTPNGTGNLTNASAIGNGALVTASNSMVLGGMGANAVNVGIGTTSPTRTLEVRGVNPILRIGTSTSVNQAVNTVIGGIEFPTLGNNDFMAKINANVGAFSDTPYLTFHTGGASAEKVRIDPNGNVGVGTTNPTSRLEISGDFKTTTGKFSSIYSINSDGTYPTNYANQIGDSQLSIGANWTGGDTDLSLINSNIANTSGGGFSFWQMTGATSKKMLAYLRGNGNLGIGTSNPTRALEVRGVNPILRIGTSTTVNQSVNTVIGGIEFPTLGNNDFMAKINANVGDFSDTPYLTFHTGGQSAEQMRIAPNGNVGIGTPTPGAYKLAVEGKIGAREVEVKVGSWADFVFKKDYVLPSLKEVEEHIQAKQHLPGIPSEAEIKEKGYALGAMDAKLLQKIEELTLYMIEQQNRINGQQKQIDQLMQLLKNQKATEQK